MKRGSVVTFTIVSLLLISITLPIAESNHTTKPNINLDAMTWTSTQVISTVSTLNSLRPVIDVDNENNIHIVWQDASNYASSGGDHDILYRFWNATTRAWSTTEVLSLGSNVASECPRIKVDEAGNLHVIWFDWNGVSDSDIYYTLRNKTTSTWETPELVTLASSLSARWPDITAKNGSAYLVWQDNTNMHGSGSDFDLFFKIRYINGTWSATEVVSTESSLISRFPSITIDDDSNIHVSWDDGTSYGGSGVDQDVFYKMRNATTETWGLTEVVSTESSSKSERSKIAIDNNGNKYVTWFDDTDYNGNKANILDSDIFYKIWNESLSSWQSTVVVSTGSNNESAVPTLKIDNFGNPHFFWFDRQDFDGTGTDRDVVYRMFNVTSNSWSSITVISLNTNFESWRPEFVIDSNNIIHVTWSDKTDNFGGSGSDWDIMYKYGFDQVFIEELAFTISPPDITYEYNTTGHQLTWQITDDNVSNPIYSIYFNDTWLLNQTWESDVSINFNIDGLDIGAYNYTLKAYDGWGDSIVDQVMVSVVLELESGPKVPGIVLDVTYGVLTAFGVVMATMLILGRRKK